MLTGLVRAVCFVYIHSLGNHVTAVFVAGSVRWICFDLFKKSSSLHPFASPWGKQTSRTPPLEFSVYRTILTATTTRPEKLQILFRSKFCTVQLLRKHVDIHGGKITRKEKRVYDKLRVDGKPNLLFRARGAQEHWLWKYDLSAIQ